MTSSKRAFFSKHIKEFITELGQTIEADQETFFDIFLNETTREDSDQAIEYINGVFKTMAAKFTEQTVVWIGRDLSGISLKDLEEFFDDVAEVTSANISKAQIEVHFLGASAQAVIDQLNGANVTARDGTGYILDLFVKRDEESRSRSRSRGRSRSPPSSSDESDLEGSDFNERRPRRRGTRSVSRSRSSSNSDEEVRPIRRSRSTRPSSTPKKRVLFFEGLPSRVDTSEIYDEIVNLLTAYSAIEAIEIIKGTNDDSRNVRVILSIPFDDVEINDIIRDLNGREMYLRPITGRRLITYQVKLRLADLQKKRDNDSESEDDQPVEYKLIAHNVPQSRKLTKIFRDFFHQYSPKEVRVLPLARGSKRTRSDVVIAFWNKEDVEDALNDLDGRMIDVAGQDYKLDLSRE
jgi:hypothetical protein